MTNNIESWLKQISDNPTQYEGKFVIHNEKEILFVSPFIKEADEWRKSKQLQFANALRLFLVPYHFGSVRLRMLKIKRNNVNPKKCHLLSILGQLSQCCVRLG